MHQVKTILIHSICWLLFFCYPIFSFWDKIQSPLPEWLWHPAALLCLLVFPAVFYGHLKVVLPRFFATKKYGRYGACFVLTTIAILWLKPIDRMFFRDGERLPQWMLNEHLAQGKSRPLGPDPTPFFVDRTSLALFLILWALGLAIWLYQSKFKFLFSALSKQLEAAASNTSTVENGTMEASLPPPVEAKKAPISLEKHLTVHVEYEQVKIPLDDIEYVEAFDGYVKIYLSNTEKPLLTRMSLRAISEKLPEEKFVRIHRSFIISADKAAAWSASKVRLKSGQELPVGRRFKDGANL